MTTVSPPTSTPPRQQLRVHASHAHAPHAHAARAYVGRARTRMTIVTIAALALGAACASHPGAEAPEPGTADDPVKRPTPFGSHSYTYPAGVILPTGTRASLDGAVKEFYDRWKAAYLTEGCGGHYVKTGGGTGAREAITVSEGHGYGMIVTALMDGHDPDAQKLFDGLHAVFRKFPSDRNRDLMSWAVGNNCQPVAGPNSATDGDLDVAFGLLLANRQWGSDGKVNYLSEAKKVIKAIAASEINPQTRLPLLGDWAVSAQYYFSTRPSDFMPDHFRAFAPVGGQAGLYQTAIDRLYETVAKLQMGRSTGLLPDFAVETDRTPRPAPADHLEHETDGDYAFNACRTPWRLGTDFVVSGDPRAKNALGPINAFIKKQSGGDPLKVSEGYRLDGTPIGGGANGAFVAPFAVGAMVDGSNQTWLDALWKWMTSAGMEDYYADSIRLLSMIVVSGNWWPPQ